MPVLSLADHPNKISDLRTLLGSENRVSSALLNDENNRGLSLGRAPGYMIRNRDRIYGTVVTRRLRARGIRDRTSAKITTTGRTSLGIVRISTSGPRSRSRTTN